MVSATLGKDVVALGKETLSNPVVVRIADDAGGAAAVANRLSQYSISLPKDEDKFLVLYSMLKLALVKSKVLIFTSEPNRAFKVKLFLERFSIKAVVLNSTLPLNSRMHILEEFNRGVFEVLIASDEKGSDLERDAARGFDAQGKSRPADKPKRERRGKRPTAEDDTGGESGVSRGIDFRNVRTVINMDFPETLRSYRHRIGRTARGVSEGTAISLVSPGDEVALAVRYRLFCLTLMLRLTLLPLISPYLLHRRCAPRWRRMA